MDLWFYLSRNTHVPNIEVRHHSLGAMEHRKYIQKLPNVFSKQRQVSVRMSEYKTWIGDLEKLSSGVSCRITKNNLTLSNCEPWQQKVQHAIWRMMPVCKKIAPDSKQKENYQKSKCVKCIFTVGTSSDIVLPTYWSILSNHALNTSVDMLENLKLVQTSMWLPRMACGVVVAGWNKTVWRHKGGLKKRPF